MLDREREGRRLRAGVRVAALALSIATAATGVAQADTARGRVFEDLDGDGVAAPGERGVAGVRISNGRDVVLTDADGRWQLDAKAGDVLFLTKPAGWMTPVDRTMIPRFYYIHQPDGSPAGLRYPGVDPTGPLPDRIDFALRRRDEPARFDAILFADPQPQTRAELDFVRDDVVSELVGTPALFGMTMGDILYDDLSLFARSNAIVAQIGIPWYNVPGNHELNLGAADDAGSLETFKRYFGPPYYSFEVADAVFYVLDNIRYLGNGTAEPGDFRGTGGYEARIGREQLAWLRRDLAEVPEDKLVFLAMHAPLRTYIDDGPKVNTLDRRELFKLLRGRRHLYAVAGHTHTTEHHYFGEEEGFRGPGEFHHHVLSTVSGSWWSGPLDDRGVPVTVQRDGTPNGYHVLEVDGKDLRLRFKAASRPASEQMRIMIDADHHAHRPETTRDYRPGELLGGRLSVDAVPAAQVIVNLYDGGPRSELRFRVDGGAPVVMERRAVVDPAMQALFARNAETMKPWVRATPSSHIWTGDLPDDLGAGTYVLSVEAKDEFGQLHHAHQVLEITGSSAPVSDEIRWHERRAGK
jgi:hypothetical protein